MNRFGTAKSHARTSDPSTSLNAASKINITAQAERVLRSYGTGIALLDVEAYAAAGFPPEARDGQRCSDLRSEALIKRTGVRRETPSGKTAYECRITTAGTTYLNSLKVVSR